jgi:hypothetical protein
MNIVILLDDVIYSTIMKELIELGLMVIVHVATELMLAVIGRDRCGDKVKQHNFSMTCIFINTFHSTS